MPILPLDAIEPGMVLEQAVCDLSGRRLLGAGEAVTARHLRIFKSWGVLEAAIRGGDMDPQPDAIPEKYQELGMKAARRLFRHANCGHPAVAKLLELCGQRLARQARRQAETEAALRAPATPAEGEGGDG